MRLRPEEVQKILQVMAKHLDPHPFQLYLFGSRTRPEARGGDIDLLVLVDDTKICPPKYKLTLALMDVLGEQKIDLVIESHHMASTNPFVASILPGAIRLN